MNEAALYLRKARSSFVRQLLRRGTESRPGGPEKVGFPSGIVGIYASLFVINVGGWLWAFFAFHRYPVLFGTALLTYTFGLRHAVDADHIAAIDNVTRKLMQQGKRPLGVGLFFSLGHSTVVFLLSVAVAFASVAFKSRFTALASIGGVLGTCVSAGFLLVIAAANFGILLSIYRTFRAVKGGGAFIDEDLDLLLAKPGLIGRLFRSAFSLIDQSWQMYLIGFLFGLGFDTATEVAVLGIAAKEAATGLPIWSILIYPTLFTAGMALVDTTDGILMIRAYRWALVKPLRKLYYNLTITLISVLVAVFIGAVEILGLLREKLRLKGELWSIVGGMNDHFGLLGFIVIAVFVLAWIASIVIDRSNRYDRIGPRHKSPTS